VVHLEEEEQPTENQPGDDHRFPPPFGAYPRAFPLCRRVKATLSPDGRE
jgi:hypothetical protein